jgi:hypothetical protein|tara:strand:+ start:1045 stop:1377 length:333 start_codon:yes stop_codon:yes gene_type:complete
MGLERDAANTRMYSERVGDSDYVEAADLADMQAKFEDNEYLLDRNALNLFGPLLYQMQKMQDELSELRRYLENEGTTVTGGSLDASDLPTSTRGLATGDLWNSRGTVSVV